MGKDSESDSEKSDLSTDPYWNAARNMTHARWNTNQNKTGQL